MISGAFFKHLFEKDNQVVVVKELVNVHSLVGYVLGIVLNHLTFNEVNLMIAIKSIKKTVLFQCSFD